MKNHRILFLFFLSIWLFLLACSTPLYKSIYQSPPVNARDTAEQWVHPYENYNQDSRLYYGVNNDRENLYISIKVSDYRTQYDILHSGIEISIDTTGKHRALTSIVFPFIDKKHKKEKTFNNDYDNTALASNNASMDLNTAKINYIHQEKLMHLSGFKAPIGGVVPCTNNFGITANLNWDTTYSKNMLLKIVIPFADFYKTKINYSDTSTIVGITFTVVDVPTPGGVGRNGYNGGSGGGFSVGMGMGMGMGMGGMGMGGMGMGMGMGGMGMGLNSRPYGNGMNQQPSSSSLKVRFRLTMPPFQLY